LATQFREDGPIDRMFSTATFDITLSTTPPGAWEMSVMDQNGTWVASFADGPHLAALDATYASDAGQHLDQLAFDLHRLALAWGAE